MKRQVLKQLTTLILALLMAGAGLTVFPTESTPGSGDRQEDLDGILGIINFLEEAAAFSRENGGFQGRVAEFSERQVAAFFQYLFSEQSPNLKSLQLKMFPGDRLEGWVVLDLNPGGQTEPRNLFLAARIEQQERGVRLNFSSLFLETQRILPEIFNALIDLIARVRGLEARHLDDWYELPEGISRVETGAGCLRVHY